MFYLLQDRLGPLPTSPAGFNTAVSAAVVQAAQAAVQRDLAVSTPVTPSTSAPVVIPSTTAFFQATQFQNSQQTPPTTPLSVSTVSSQDPLFNISDHFVNGNTSGTFTTVVNGNTNSLTTIQCRKINENSLVVSCLFKRLQSNELKKRLLLMMMLLVIFSGNPLRANLRPG